MAVGPWAFLALPVVFWGSSYRATAIGGDHTSGLMFAALRVVLFTVPLLLAFPFLGGRLPRGRALAWSALSGVLLVSVFFIGISEGTVRAGAANASVLIATAPFFVAIFGRIFLGEHVSRLAAAGLVVGFAGVVLMVVEQLGVEHGAGRLVGGMAFALAAGAGFAVGTLLVRALAVRAGELDLLGLTFAQYFVGAPFLVVLAFAVHGSGGTDWGSGELWGAAAYLAVAGSGLGTLGFFAALKRLTAARTSSAQFLVPVVAVLIEIARGAAPGGTVLAGMALATIGVAVVVAAPYAAKGHAGARSR